MGARGHRRAHPGTRYGRTKRIAGSRGDHAVPSWEFLRNTPLACIGHIEIDSVNPVAGPGNREVR